MTNEWRTFRVRPYGIDRCECDEVALQFTHTLCRMTREMIHKLPKTFLTTLTDG